MSLKRFRHTQTDWMISQGWLGGAGSNMRSIYDASETAYQAIVAVEVAPQVLV
jgi:hypothetical protein